MFQVYTIPEYMQKRFGGDRIRIYLSVLSIILAIVTKLAVSIFAGALFIQLALGWDMYLSIIVLLLVTALFTVLGGLTVVMLTDTLQTGIMIIGALALTGISFAKVGGLSNLVDLYMNATPSIRTNNSSCGVPRDDAFDIFRDTETGDLPWPGVLCHVTLGAIWYFSCDQVIVQRSLAAQTLSHAKGGSILAGYLKILPLFIMILPGMISRALYPDEIACVDPEECRKYCQNRVGCSNIAYPKLVLELLPTGLRGLLMAVMLSAIMSSLTSIFNSASTLFTMDIWRKARRHASERELLVVGRVFIIVISAISILWVPLVKSSKSGQLFIYLQSIQSYLGTPLCPVFLFAILWGRMTEKAAFLGLLVGHICGVIRMIMDFVMPAPGCGQPETRPAILYKVHFTYFSLILFVIGSLTILVVSLMTTPTKDFEGMTLFSLKRKLGKEFKSDAIEQEDPGTLPESPTVRKSFQVIGPDELGEESDSTSNKKGHVRRVLYRICGLPEGQDRTIIDVDTTRLQMLTFMREKQVVRKLLNANAALGILIIVFIFGYFH